MKKSRLVRLAILLVTTLTLSACIWPGYEEHRGEGDRHGEEHGNHHEGDRHGDDNGDHR